MSNYSERKLQQALHQARFYTQKAPSSGHGILDPETEEYIDQADIVAIRAITRHVLEDGDGGAHESMRIPQVLVIEDKHEKPPQVYIEDHEKQQLERIEEVTAATAYFAVKWKNQQGEHQFYSPDDLIDTGKHWKITEETSGMVLNDIV